MTLRRQLLLVSLLLLCLPWAGCQFVREMEGALRYGQAQSLQATAQAIAAVLSEQPALIYPHPGRRGTASDSLSLYAHALQEPLILDGYGDGWEPIEARRFHSARDGAPLEVSYRGVTRGDYLYLLLQVTDPQVIYHNPGLSREPNGDRLLLRTWQDGRRQDYVIATAAPGSVRAVAASRRQRGTDAARIRGFWRDTAQGYTLELELPLAYTGGRLGFYAIDTGGGANGAVTTAGNITPLDTAAPPWLIYSPAPLQLALTPFSRNGSQIQVVDTSHWLLANLQAQASTDTTDSATFWLVRWLYRSVLARDELEPAPTRAKRGRVLGGEVEAALRGQPASRRYRDPRQTSRTTLSAATPIADDRGVLGAVIVRQSSEQYLSLTDRAFSRLLLYSLLALGTGALGLLGYASWLSWRIGRLSRAARNAVREDGAISPHFPRSAARDEIGELSRRYADLLHQLREYNDYLRTLSRKLSHELRTPIAVIQTSLENLELARVATPGVATPGVATPGVEQHTAHPSDCGIYLARARDGLARLNRILTAMSEANRLEESIRNSQPRPVALAPLLGEVFEAYRDVYAGHQLSLDIQSDSAVISGVPDLIVQALDKLLDNAVSFCPAGGRITLRLAAAAGGWELSVCNAGPALPDELREHLFDPMVSLRDKTSPGIHLGLGLYIVRLICDFHHGRVRAENLADASGVCVALFLPAVDSQADGLS